MGLTDRIRKVFSSFPTQKPVDKVAATKTITNELVSYLLGLSAFDTIDDNDIYEQLYVWEPEIGGAIDRMSTMVGESYKYCCLKDTVQSRTPLHEKMIEDANKIAEELDVRTYMEQFAEILSLHGNLFLEVKDDMLEILPNKYVSLIDTRDRLTGNMTGIPGNVITSPTMLVLYEGDTAQRIIPHNKYLHVKYKNTPIYRIDRCGRLTWGVYSPSPLHRVILPIWWKRQTMIIDILWRMMNIPREHHQINADMFSLDKYAGDITTRKEQALADARKFLQEYSEQMRNRMPDQGYATLDTVKITKLDNKSSSYMQTNELINQINDQIWTALNMPKSMINGESSSSYASELVIANYVTQKVNQLAYKIKPVVLRVLRDRLKMLNKSYPVEDLDLYLDLDIAVTELEKFRQMAIMAQLGVFTEDEIRQFIGYAPLSDEQRSRVIQTSKQGKQIQEMQLPGIEPVNPQTPVSSIQHGTDIGQDTYKKMENKR